MKSLESRIQEARALLEKNLKEKFPGKKRGEITVGVTFGAFELCHAGHMLMFEEAKAQCDYFLVGLDADPALTPASYRGKQKHHPVMSIPERHIILSSIKYIDQIFDYYEEGEVREFLKGLSPDVRIIGADWKDKNPTGHELPIKMYYNSRTHNYSTTELIERIRNRK